MSASLQTQASGRAQAIDGFMSTVGELYEKDYGDFMRRVVLYLERLVQESGAGPQEKKALLEIKSYLVYNPNFDIESTRNRVLRDVRNIAEKMKR